MKCRIPCIILLSFTVLCSGQAEAIECPSQVGVLKGTKITEYGGMRFSYTETLELSREYGREDLEGRWMIKRFAQDMVYPGNIPVSMVQPPAEMDLGGGHSLICSSRVVGNRVETRCEGGTAYLDVQGGKIGSAKTGLWTGTVQPNGWARYQFHETTPMLTGWLKEPEKKDLSVEVELEYDDHGRYVYTAIGPGKLLVSAKAKVEPAKYADQVKWTLPEIEGSTLDLRPVTATGPEIMGIYNKMPEKNSEFGKKIIKATLQVDECVVEAEKEFEAFYERDARNNGSMGQPNWFFYWSQTTCGKPYGQKINILWDPTYPDCASGGSTLASFPYNHHWTPHKGFYMCDLETVLGQEFKQDIPLVGRSGSAPNIQFVYDGEQTSYGIDTFGVTVMHEFQHFLNYQRWWQGYGIPYSALWAAHDKDRDGIPDIKEADMGFDPNRTMSFGGDRLKAHLQYDEHWLAYEKTRDYSLGSCKEEDWAHPGSNWK